MSKNFSKKTFQIMLIVLLVITLGVLGYLKLTKPDTESFMAPGKAWNSEKKVEDYFIDRLRMSQKEASEIRSRSGVDGQVNLRISDKTTLNALVSNLYYYGFIRDEESFQYALTHTKDTTPSDKAIMVDKERTIDINAEYRISENMDAWQIADILLNKPSGHFLFDEYGYFFMP